MAELSYVFKQTLLIQFDTLKNTSYDKENRMYLCNSDMSVVDFDKVSKKSYPQKIHLDYKQNHYIKN